MVEDTLQEDKTSPLATVKPGSADLMGQTNTMLAESLKNLQDNRVQKKAILDKAIANLESRMPKVGEGPSAEELLRLSAAFGSPTKTGGFGEMMSNVSGAGADLLKGRRESQSALDDLMTKYKLQGLDVDSDYLKNVLSTHKELASSGVQSTYGKIAIDEGFQPGTPEFANRVKQLSQVDIDVKVQKAQGTKEGEFEPKTGNFVTPGGTVIPKGEVTKDREQRQKLLDQKAAFAKIDKKTINNAISRFNITGSGMFGDVAKGIGSVVSEDTLNAQTKIYSQAIEGIQKALPPGPASDKDVAQAKATFPGFGSKKALSEWLKSLEELVDRHLKTQDDKYGSGKWFGASGAPKAGGDRNDLGETKDEQRRMKDGKSSAPPPAPKVGAILNGHRFKGGDPSKEESWEKV